MLMPGGQSTRDGPLRAHRRPVFPGPRPRQVCSPGAGHAGPPEASEESVPGPWRSQNPSLPAVNVHIGALRRAKGGYAGDPTSSRRCQRARLATRLRRLLAGAHAHKARRHQCAHRLHRRRCAMGPCRMLARCGHDEHRRCGRCGRSARAGQELAHHQGAAVARLRPSPASPVEQRAVRNMLSDHTTKGEMKNEGPRRCLSE